MTSTQRPEAGPAFDRSQPKNAFSSGSRPELAEAVAAHRADYWLWVELHAEEPRRSALLRLRDHWHAVNETHFGGVLVLPYITLTAPSKSSVYGQCCSVSSWGSRLEIKLRPSLLSGTHPHVSGNLEGCWRFVADVLTHETLHQHAIEVTGETEDSYHGHGPAFTETANRIGETLGLAPVKVRNRNGSHDPIGAQWPHCVRDPSYYLGAYTPPDRPARSTGDTVPCPQCKGAGTVTRDTVPQRITWKYYDGPLPANTKLVTRATRYGNPFEVTEKTPAGHAQAVDKHRRWLRGDADLIAEARRTHPRLSRDVVLDEAPVVFATNHAACSCPQGWPCHGDTLLAIGRGEQP